MITSQATAAPTKLKPIWRDNIPLVSKVKLMRSLVISIFMYVCESWALAAELEKRMQMLGDEMLPKAMEHFVQGPHYQFGGSQKDRSSNWRL